jgi:hypothetical protein
MLLYSDKIGNSYQITISSPPWKDEDFLFHHAVLFENTEIYKCCLLKKDKTAVKIFFAVSGRQIISLPDAPFGGFWSEQPFSAVAFLDFIKHLSAFFKKKGFQSMSIIQAPCLIEPKSEYFEYLLSQVSFQPTSTLYHLMSKGKQIIAEKAQYLTLNYADRMCRHHFTFKIDLVLDCKFLQKITEWNLKRGYAITWSAEKLEKDIQSFPSKYYVITVFRGDEPVGYVLAVRLSTSQLYYFLSAINPENQYVYTGEFLMMGLFQLAASLEIDTLDLGSSQLGSIPNFSLLHFKKRFSNAGGNKVTWTKKFNE